MAEYGYNSELADVIRPLGQGTVSKTEYGFRTIPNVEVRANSSQNRIDTSRWGSGQQRGTQQVRGQFQVVNAQGRKVMIMGYKKGGF